MTSFGKKLILILLLVVVGGVVLVTSLTQSNQTVTVRSQDTIDQTDIFREATVPTIVEETLIEELIESVTEPVAPVIVDEVSSPEEEPLKADQENQSPETEEEPVGPVRVMYTNEGFSPAETTAKVGQTIEFINESDVSMWVASDPHPVHTDDPAFDAKKVMAPGEIYRYSFDEIGEYGFHNHIESTHRGAISVTE